MLLFNREVLSNVKNIRRTFIEIHIKIIAALPIFFYGLAQTWCTPHPSPSLTETQTSWLVSAVHLGAPAALVAAGAGADVLGRRRQLLACSAFGIISSIIKLSCTAPAALITSQVVSGLGSGVLIISPLYVQEMTGDTRSGHCQWVVLSLAIGNLASFLFSELVSLSTVCWLVAAAQLATLAAQAWLPDTPYYYVMKGDNKKASETLCWLKCVNSTDITVRDDINSLTIEQVHESTKLSPSRIFADKTTVEAFFIVLVLTVLRELCGSLTILTYSSEILEAADRFTPTNCFILTSNQQGILIAMAQVLGLMLACLIVNKCGAKPLLVASTMLISISTSLLGVWFFVSHHGVALPGWVPVAAASTSALADAVGLRLVCFCVITDMFYHRLHHTASTMFIAITALINLGQTRFFLPLVSCIGYHHVFFIFTGISILLFFYVVFNVPETKVREVDEIYDELKEDNAAMTEDDSEMVYPQLQDAILNEGSAYILTPFMSRRIWNR